MSILSKLRTELYKVSEFEDCEYDNDDKVQPDNNAIFIFLDKARSLRGKSDYEIIDSFSKILVCDMNLIIKVIFYLRDVKYGLGERRVFRVIINYLALNRPELMVGLLPLIPKYGRWDDYYALFNTPLENEVINIFKIQINADLNSKKPSILAKWLKSENTSSKHSRKLGVKTRNLMGLTSQEYRLILSSLRRKIRYDEINNKISDFKLKCPIDIIDTIVKKINTHNIYDELYEGLWIEACEEYKSFCDDTCVLISVSKATKYESSEAFKAAISSVIFYNRLNYGGYKDYYMYFTPKPHFGKVKNSGVCNNVRLLNELSVERSNNIECGLDLLLFTSIKKNLSNEDMPKNILIISDTDLEYKYKDNNNIQLIKNKWGLAGYVMPKLKFWQIEKYSTIQNVSKDIYSNIFAKGYSQEIFDSILRGDICDGNQLQLEKLLGDRYSEIAHNQ